MHENLNNEIVVPRARDSSGVRDEDRYGDTSRDGEIERQRISAPAELMYCILSAK